MTASKGTVPIALPETPTNVGGGGGAGGKKLCGEKAQKLCNGSCGGEMVYQHTCHVENFIHN